MCSPLNHVILIMLHLTLVVIYGVVVVWVHGWECWSISYYVALYTKIKIKTHKKFK